MINLHCFKKSKLTYKLILGKQKQDSISNPVLVSASICSEWLVGPPRILWSWAHNRRNGVRFPKHPQNVSRSFFQFQILRTVKKLPTFHFWTRLLASCGVELGLTGLTSTSRSIRTTCSKSLALLRSSVSVLSVRPRILIFSEQPFPVQFPTLSSLMDSRLASCPFLRIVFLGFHCPWRCGSVLLSLERCCGRWIERI